MNKWLRHHRYALGVALRRLRQHPFSSLANIVVIALMLAVPILGAAVLQSSQPLARQLAVAPELTLFLQSDTPPAAQQALLARVRTEGGERIAQARLMPRATRPWLSCVPTRPGRAPWTPCPTTLCPTP